MTLADLVIKISADTANAEKNIKGFAGKTQALASKAAIPAAAALGLLAVGFKKTTDAATALGESQNAVNVVFGKGAGKIHAFAKVADKQAGLSMRQLNELVTPLGASFINLGDSQDVAATKSVALAKRAADMASVFNVDVSEALGAIQAGLRGEADPLERFGVGLSDAAVSAKAMEMGLAKTTAELTAGDKAQARYALLMEQTNRLQGDFARTSDSAANSARINAAAQENVAASIGTGLLPVVKMYQSAIAVLIGFMAEHTGVVKVAAAVLGALAGVILLVAGSMFVLNTVMAANPIVLVIVGLVALGAALIVAYQKVETFRNIVNTAWNAIRTATQVVWPLVKAIILTAVEAAATVVRTYTTIVRTVLTTAWNAIRAVTSAVWPVVSSIITGAMSAVRTAVNAARSAIDLIRAAIDRVEGPASTVAGVVRGALSGAFRFLKTAVSGISGVLGAISSVLSSIASAADSAASAIGRVISAAGNIPGAGLVQKGLGLLGRAAGGPVSAGGTYMVGERGPELFVPRHSGTIIPNHELGGGGRSVTVHVNGAPAEPLDEERLTELLRRVEVLYG